jgi:membrane fusion protein (multidrug efflux system)
MGNISGRFGALRTVGQKLAYETQSGHIPPSSILMNAFMRNRTGVFLGCLAGCLIGLAGCGASGKSEPAKGAPQPPPPAVGTALVKVMTVPVMGDFIGQSAAIQTVNIIPRVTGFLEKIDFTEGLEVHTGQALFQIEQTSYRIAISSAQAKLAQDQAQLVKYQRDVARLEPLAAQHAATQTDLDTAVSGAAQQKAAMESDQAAIDTAKLNFSYTVISSPIDGMIGKLAVTKGNLVTAEQTTALVTISSYDPIYVYFTVPEALYLTVRRKLGSQEAPPPIPLNLVLADGKPMPNKGVLDFSARTVDSQTGTLSVRGVFPNPGGLLRPGEFTRVRFIIEERPGTVLVPKGAVTEVLNMKVVFVLDAANKAMQKTVTLDGDYQDDFIVHSGLQGGERVVVEGVDKVHGGMTVNPVSGNRPGSSKPESAKK